MVDLGFAVVVVVADELCLGFAVVVVVELCFFVVDLGIVVVVVP